MKNLDLQDDLFNPTFTENSDETKDGANTTIAKCPTCGANLVYNPEIQGLSCPYCGNEKTLSQDNYCVEQDVSRLFNERRGEWNSETKTFVCENCGATTVISKDEISKTCAFCGTSNIMERQDISGMRPDAVLPFTVTHDVANEKLVVWAKKKFFAPSKFKKSVKAEKINGNYYPSFTFDANTDTRYSGRLGKYYYVNKVVNGKTVREKRIRYFNVKGTHSGRFDDVLIQATDRIPQKTVDKLCPFDTNSSQKYSPDYLYGFSATQYSKDGTTCYNEAKQIMYERVKKAILASYDYDVVDSFRMEMHCNDVTYKYVLLPVYVGHYKYREKLYNFFVNGRNGNVAGKTPTSPLRVGALVIGIIAVIVGIVLLYLYGGN